MCELVQTAHLRAVSFFVLPHRKGCNVFLSAYGLCCPNYFTTKYTFYSKLILNCGDVFGIQGNKTVCYHLNMFLVLWKLLINMIFNWLWISFFVTGVFYRLHWGLIDPKLMFGETTLKTKFHQLLYKWKELNYSVAPLKEKIQWGLLMLRGKSRSNSCGKEWSNCWCTCETKWLQNIVQKPTCQQNTCLTQMSLLQKMLTHLNVKHKPKMKINK